MNIRFPELGPYIVCFGPTKCEDFSGMLVGPEAEVMSSLINTHTTCGSCGCVYDKCISRTVKTVSGGWQRVELCRYCLLGILAVLSEP
jgi:hypothetical protein